MKAMRTGIFVIALVLGTMVNGSLFAKDAISRVGVSSVVTTTGVYQGSSDLAQVSGWIKKASPSYTPVMALRKVTISRTVKSSGLATIQGVGDAPVDLPTNGMNGEKLTIRNEYPEGSYESWTYEWVDGGSASGWILRDYQFHNSGKDEGVPTQPF
ncbi:hypothetical protein [Xanthomonas axonopodis]|uniref:hypothetical protein n=1 Tax=Xanthomonas axonopodis TaxID=53413 RepID=UPI0011161A3C|nr:hypothetical protein [Xanthomonas axonopodis]